MFRSPAVTVVVVDDWGERGDFFIMMCIKGIAPSSSFLDDY